MVRSFLTEQTECNGNIKKYVCKQDIASTKSLVIAQGSAWRTSMHIKVYTNLGGLYADARKFEVLLEDLQITRRAVRCAPLSITSKLEDLRKLQNRLMNIFLKPNERFK